MTFSAVLDRLVALVFPPRCIMCRTPVPYGQDFCGKCHWDYLSAAQRADISKNLANSAYARALAVFRYDTTTARAILAMKTYQDKRTLTFFAREMAQCLAQEWGSGSPIFDVITCVPMSPKTRRSRGFNHAEVLAQQLSALFELPFAEDLLTRDNCSLPQRRLVRAERFPNAARSYQPGRQITKARGLHILLIDDVLTTGATVGACATLLQAAGAASVSVMAACAPIQAAERDFADEPELAP